jgi:hypothetical protein
VFTKFQSVVCYVSDTAVLFQKVVHCCILLVVVFVVRNKRTNSTS